MLQLHISKAFYTLSYRRSTKWQTFLVVCRLLNHEKDFFIDIKFVWCYHFYSSKFLRLHHSHNIYSTFYNYVDCFPFILCLPIFNLYLAFAGILQGNIKKPLQQYITVKVEIGESQPLNLSINHYFCSDHCCCRRYGLKCQSSRMIFS
jgi:hypothetical protein